MVLIPAQSVAGWLSSKSSVEFKQEENLEILIEIEASSVLKREKQEEANSGVGRLKFEDALRYVESPMPNKLLSV